jgi:photosystem II stability/assembly factor-like uncharacterized protein
MLSKGIFAFFTLFMLLLIAITQQPTTAAINPLPDHSTLSEPGVWSSNGPRGGAANALEVSPNFAADGVVFSGEWLNGRYGDQTGIGVIKSTDHGQTWNLSATGTEGEYYSRALHDFAFSPNFAADQTLFAATWGALYRSTNAGATWNLVESLYNGPPGWFHEVAVAPDFASSGHMIVSGGPQGMSVSQDGGETWTAAERILGNLTYSPNFTADQMVFGSTYNALYQSVDGGLTWTDVLSTEITAVAISPNFATDQTLWSARRDLNISNDGGATWISRTVSADTTYIWDLVVSPQFATDQTLFAAANSGLHWSTDGGLNWTAVAEYAGQNILKLAISPQWPDHPVLLVGTSNGVYRLLTPDPLSGEVLQVTQGLAILSTGTPVLSADGSLLLVGAINHGIYGSTDSGATWQPQGQQGGGSYYSIPSLAIAPDYPADQTLFAARASGVSIGGSIHRSLDGGATWQSVYSTDYTGNLTFSPGFATDQTIFATGNNGRVIQSTDGGDNWAQLPNWPPDLSNRAIRLAVPPTYPADGRLFVGSDKGFWFTANNGANWHQATTGLTNEYQIYNLVVSPAFATDNTLLAVAYWSDPAPTYAPHYAVFRSTDGGLNWLQSSVGLPDKTLSITLSPHFTTDAIAYAVTEHALYRSQDGGQSWALVGSPPVDTALGQAVVGRDGSVFVTSTNGVWRYHTLVYESIVNGGFEVDSGWELPITPIPGEYSEVVAHNGRRAMQLGLHNESNMVGYSSARQLIHVPADARVAALEFHLYPVSEEVALASQSALLPAGKLAEPTAPATGDAQYVLLLDPTTGAVEAELYWGLTNTQAWQPVRVNLAEYAGQTWRLHFGVYNDGANGRTALYVDDVSLLILESSAAPFAVYLPIGVK